MATSTRRSPKGFSDAIALLKADHRKVSDLFEKFERARSGNKQSLAHEICNELKIHTIIEEEIFYPALKGKIEQDTWSEAFVEHDGAKVLVNDIVAASPEDDEFYDAKVKVLSEEIEDHVAEEGKRVEGMFAQAKKAGLDMDALGQQMADEKERLMAQYKTDGLPTPKTTTFTAPGPA